MTRIPSTLILAGALAAACSKDNPLFLDTWGGVSDSGTVTDTGASTLTGDPTTAPPPTTSTTDPPPTTGTAATGTSDVSTSSVDPTSEGTTGEPFFCNAEMDGCCQLLLEPEADNFFADAVDGVAPQEAGCPYIDGPPAEFEKLQCGKWSFGQTPKLRLFNDYEGKWNEAVVNSSLMALRFPMKDGQLVADGVPIPWDVVELMAIDLTVEVDWEYFSDFVFDLYGLPVDQTWTEGDGPGAVPCTGGNSCYYCRVCGETPDECTEGWSAQKPLTDHLATLEAVPGPDLTQLQMVVPDPQTLAGAPAGLVLVPIGVTYEGQPRTYVPSGAVIAHARESGAPPRLRLKLCMQQP